MALDEVTQIAPIPLPSLLADSGGKGVQIIAAVLGKSKLEERWQDAGAQGVWDCCGVKVLLRGIDDPHTLETVRKLAGEKSFTLKGQEHVSQHPVMAEDMVRGLPKKFALVLRGGLSPVVTRVPVAWHDWGYLRAKWAGWAVFKSAPALLADPLPEVTVPRLMPEPAAEPARVLQLVPDSGNPAGWPEWEPPAPNGNGNGHGNGHGHG